MANIPEVLRFTGLQLTSLITGVMAVVLGMVYFGPDSLIRRPLPEGQISVVVAVENFAPVWPILFTLVGVALIASATARKWVVVAHVLAIFGWTFYGSAILIGALLSEPPTPVVMGITSLFVAAVHFGLMQAHQDAGEL